MSCSRPNGAKNANEKTITETCQRKSVEKVQLCILVGSKSGSEVRMLGGLISSCSMERAICAHQRFRETGKATKSDDEVRSDVL
jgi:hypothetical protein